MDDDTADRATAWFRAHPLIPVTTGNAGYDVIL